MPSLVRLGVLVLSVCWMKVEPFGGEAQVNFFPKGDAIVVNHLGHLAAGYSVYGLNNLDFFRFNYIHPGRVVLFSGTDTLYPSIELAPFSARGLQNLEANFSGKFYHNSLQQGDPDLNHLNGVVQNSHLQGSFAATAADVFTWEDASFGASMASFQATITTDGSGTAVVIFTYGSVSHSATAPFSVLSAISSLSGQASSVVVVTIPDTDGLATGSNMVDLGREGATGTFAFQVDSVNCFEDEENRPQVRDLYICIDDLPQNFTILSVNTSAASFAYQDLTHPNNTVNFTLECLSPNHITSVPIAQETVQTVSMVTISDLLPFQEYQCMVKKTHSLGTTPHVLYLDIFTGTMSAPAVPENLTVVSIGEDHITINWTSPDPLITTLAPAEGYYVAVGNDAKVFVANSTWYNVTGLQPLQMYVMVVSSNNSYGTSDPSLPLAAATLEAPPTNLTVEAASYTATVVFQERFSTAASTPVTYVASCTGVDGSGDSGAPVPSPPLVTSGVVLGEHRLQLEELVPNTTYNCSLVRYNSVSGVNLTQFFTMTSNDSQTHPNATVSEVEAERVVITLNIQSSNPVSIFVVCTEQTAISHSDNDTTTTNNNTSQHKASLNTSSIANGMDRIALDGLSPSTAYNCTVTSYDSVTGENRTQEVAFTTPAASDDEEDDDSFSPGEIAGIVVGCVAAAALAAVGLGGMAGLLQGGGACCAGGGGAAAEAPVDPSSVMDAIVAAVEFIKEHCCCCCCCEKDDEEEEEKGKGAKRSKKGAHRLKSTEDMGSSTSLNAESQMDSTNV